MGLKDCSFSALPDIKIESMSFLVRVFHIVLFASEPRIIDYFVEVANRMIDLGIAGFRFDAVKHMWEYQVICAYSVHDNKYSCARHASHLTVRITPQEGVRHVY